VTGFEFVAAVIAAFFVIGIVVGVIAVVAMSALRSDRGRLGNRTRRLRRGTGSPLGRGPGWEEPPGPDEEDSGYPRWPGG
jgi:hypothetical protein